MVYEALAGLLGEKTDIDFAISGEHDHRSYSDICGLINRSGISERAKEKALSIYSVIAKAEAAVHGTTVSEVHFHEVGRDQAVRNIIGTAVCLEALGVDKILCSEICDGKGHIQCSHGTIPVPVPAVTAMKSGCNLVFTIDENVKTEMATPSGLAILIGLSAEYSKEIPEGEILKKAVAFGKRETGRQGGFAAYLVDSGGPGF